ncbi:MAG: H-type lectin domain-containing protein [Trichodesmium sp. St18_bin1]|jgi:H-type lectin domain.|nr:H-type lectin domain-containing protein [Trichodesmium sp. St18_bin1]MDE5119356.1 H-type lectin domain-containing protein [Trichodesmium sp. St19_bin1]
MKKIVGLLSLVLCLAIWFISPLAQASESDKLWKINSPYLIFQGGTVSYTAYEEGDKWNLNSGSGDRTLVKHVDFGTPYYSDNINVAVYLTGIDQDNAMDNRLQINPTNVTNQGFDIEYKTWSDSVINGLWLSWVAFGD